MSTSMRASMTLDLSKDKLTAGLNSIKKDFDQLKEKGKDLTLGKLDTAVPALTKVSQEVRKATEAVSGLGTGLNAVKKDFDQLKTSSAALKIGNLEDGNIPLTVLRRRLRAIREEVTGLGTNLDMTTVKAGRTWAELRRVASARIGAGMGAVGGAVSSGIGGARTALAAGGRWIGNAGGAVAAASEGIALVKPVADYASFENTLRHIAITEKKSGPDVEAEVARITKNLKTEAMATGQNSAELAKAYTFLITTGMSSGLVDSLMPTHAKAATAYNISSDSMGQAVFALNDSFKIDHNDMGAALSAMAYAAKEAHFTVENFSQFLPAIGGRLQLLGMSGRGAADTTFAALETVVKNSSMPSQAATNFQDLLQYMTAPIATRSFKQQGIDLPGMLTGAEKRGINPLDAFLGKLDQLTKGKSPVEAAEIIGKLVHNQEAASAALSILQHKDEFLRMRDMLGRVGPETLETDFQTAFRAPKVKLNSAEEAGQQLERRVGEGFEPVVTRLSDGLKSIVGQVDSLDAKFPGLGDVVLNVTAGMLALGAALAAIGFVAPAIMAAVALIGGAPVVAAGALTAGATAAAMWLINLDVAGDLEKKGLGVPMIGADGEAINLGPSTPLRLPPTAFRHIRHSWFGEPDDAPAGQDIPPLQFNLPSGDMQAPLPATSDQPVKLDLTVHTDAGTTVTVNNASQEGIVHRWLHRNDAGPTTNRP